MIRQTNEPQRKSATHLFIPCEDLNMLCLITLLVLAMILVACSAPSYMPTQIVVQTALPTPTLEPTFTPSPRPTATPQPSPTATPAQSTSTPTPQSVLLGRILDQDTNQPVTGAKIRVGTLTATTDADGRYTLTGLPPGQYVLSVTHPDYDPGLSSIFTLAAGQELSLDLTLYAPDASPYPKDPMLTNPLDPNGAPTAEDAERLARLQGMTGEMVDIRETKLSGEHLVNYKIGDEVRAAVAELNHEVWELTDDAGRTWWIIKVCGNLASPLPAEVAVATPQPRPLPPMAEVITDKLSVRACASEVCAEVGTLQQGARVEVLGCLADSGWCRVGLPGGGSGWCHKESLRHLAVAEAVPTLEDLREIIYADASGLWLMKSDGSDRRQVHSGEARHPAWSPDGAKISFTTTHDDIIIAEPDTGKQITEISLQGHQIEYPAHFSPDGQQLVITYNREAGPRSSPRDICMIGVDGSNLTCLTETGRAICPSWSPSGERIIFSQFGEAVDRADIYTIRKDGSDLRQLTSAGKNTCPSWSPDGQLIAYYHQDEAADPQKLQVYIMNKDGPNPRPLAFDEAIDLGAPSWSPDGTTLAIYGMGGGVYLVPVDGSRAKRVADGADPAWRPLRRR